MSSFRVREHTHTLRIQPPFFLFANLRCSREHESISHSHNPFPFSIRYRHCSESTQFVCSSFSLTNLRFRRYTRWVTRYVAVATIGAIWILAAFVSFVPISLGLHRPNEPLIIEIRNGKEYQMCALDLTPTYAMVSSCISFYVPCVVLVGIYCR